MSDFFRVASAVPVLQVANPVFNGEKILELYHRAVEENTAVVVFPELSLTGSSCGDLFEQYQLLECTQKVLSKIAQETKEKSTILAIGLPWLCGSRLFNACAVCSFSIRVRRYSVYFACIPLQPPFSILRKFWFRKYD